MLWLILTELAAGELPYIEIDRIIYGYTSSDEAN